MSFFENTRKPVGLGGKLMVAMMNLGHSPVAQWGLQFLRLAPNAKVLDWSRAQTWCKSVLRSVAASPDVTPS